MKKIIIGIALAIFFSTTSNANEQTDLSYVYKKNLVIDQVNILDINDKENILCMSMNMYHESRGTIESSIIGVGYVTLNRAKDGESSCDIVYEQTNGIPEFSWTRTNKNILKEIETFRKIEYLAYKIYFNKLPDPTNGATNFYLIGVDHPKWGNSGTRTKLGPHMFVKLK